MSYSENLICYGEQGWPAVTVKAVRRNRLRAWMTLANNSITLSGEGPENSGASVLLKAAPAGKSRK
jgi:hypothetical protein